MRLRITIEGDTGAGKSTLARILAAQLASPENMVRVIDEEDGSAAHYYHGGPAGLAQKYAEQFFDGLDHRDGVEIVTRQRQPMLEAK